MRERAKRRRGEEKEERERERERERESEHSIASKHTIGSSKDLLTHCSLHVNVYGNK